MDQKIAPCLNIFLSDLLCFISLTTLFFYISNMKLHTHGIPPQPTYFKPVDNPVLFAVYAAVSKSLIHCIIKCCITWEINQI
jgi:hypothetical protein